MLLSKLLSEIEIGYEIAGAASGLDVKSIEIDSRLAKENSIFVALKGIEVDGYDFIGKAIENGAKVIVVHEDYDIGSFEAVFIKTPNSFALLTALLKGFYSISPKNIYGVTGTNGKTSIVEFMRQIMGLLGKKSASIGTLGVVSEVDLSRKIVGSSLTTSDIVSLHKNLAMLKGEGIEDVAIEISSIGLEQKRINGLDVSVASFSNFSIDHLDYHKNKEEYLSCKMLLFNEYLDVNGKAILNSDVEEFSRIQDICVKRGVEIIEYGKNAKHLKILDIELGESGQKVKVEIFGEYYEFELSINGEFQIYNVLCALGNILAVHNLSSQEVFKLLSQFRNLRSAQGRMDLAAKLSNKARVFIDFAHTPDALDNVLRLARNIAKNRVLVMFGCGGNRDKTKRSVMGKIASDLADFVIVTDDNPRNEDAATVRSEIITGITSKNFAQISPRALAIKEAVDMLEQDDILILAGKGHEKYQIIDGIKHDFDEEKIVKNAVSKLS